MHTHPVYRLVPLVSQVEAETKGWVETARYTVHARAADVLLSPLISWLIVARLQHRYLAPNDEDLPTVPMTVPLLTVPLQP